MSRTVTDMTATDLYASLNGHITLVSPLTITRYVGRGMRPANVPEDLARFPNVLVATGDGIYERRPMLPGDHLKGVLRDHAFWTVYEAIERAIRRDPDRARGAVGSVRDYFSLDDADFLMKGGRRGSASTTADSDIRARERRRRNPIVGLFGAAEGGFSRGSLSILHSIAPVRLSMETMDCSERSRVDPFRRDPEIYARFDKQVAADHAALTADTKAGSKLRLAAEKALAEVRRLRRLGRDPALGAAARAKVMEDLQHAEAALEAADQALGAHKTEMEGKSGLTRILPPLYAIPACTRLESTIRLNGASLVELGLLLAALRRFSLCPRVGGHEASGHGYLAMRYTLALRAREEPDSRQVATVQIGPANPIPGQLDPAATFQLDDLATDRDPLLQAALDAWEEASADPLDPARFDWHASSSSAGGTGADADA